MSAASSRNSEIPVSGLSWPMISDCSTPKCVPKVNALTALPCIENGASLGHDFWDTFRIDEVRRHWSSSRISWRHDFIYQNTVQKIPQRRPANHRCQFGCVYSLPLLCYRVVKELYWSVLISLHLLNSRPFVRNSLIFLWNCFKIDIYIYIYCLKTDRPIYIYMYNLDFLNTKF